MTSAVNNSNLTPRERCRQMRLQEMSHTPLPTQRAAQTATTAAAVPASSSRMPVGNLNNTSSNVRNNRLQDPNELVARLAALDGATLPATRPNSTQRMDHPHREQREIHETRQFQRQSDPFTPAPNGQFSTPASAIRSVRSVVQAPSFSVLDHESMHAPSPQRPRFRDIDTSAILPEPQSSFVDEPLPDIRTQAARLKRQMAADALRQERPLDVRRSDFTPAADALRYDELRNDDITRTRSTQYRGDDNYDQYEESDENDDAQENVEREVAFVVDDATVVPYAPSPRFVMTGTPLANSRLLASREV